MENQVKDISMTPVAIGEFWQNEGGYYMGNIEYPNGDVYALLVPPKELGEQNDIKWATAYQSVNPINTNSWDGYTNTRNNNNATFPLFQWACGLTINEKTDWYIFAKDELNVCYTNRKHLTPNQQFEEDWYWSSSWYSSNYAWGQYFLNGPQGTNLQIGTSRGRAGRRVKLMQKENNLFEDTTPVEFTSPVDFLNAPDKSLNYLKSRRSDARRLHLEINKNNGDLEYITLGYTLNDPVRIAMFGRTDKHLFQFYNLHCAMAYILAKYW